MYCVVHALMRRYAPVSHTFIIGFYMRFEHWVVENTQARMTSALKYSGALTGRLSNMAIEHGLSKVDLFKSTCPKVVATKLKELDEFADLNSTGNSMYSRALDLFLMYLESNEPTIEEELEAIILDPSTTPTEKSSLVQSRLGQGKFRQKLFEIWGCCSITNCKEAKLLIASHIKPWSQCTNEERLDPSNGLLLIATLDKAFDSGLISFDRTGMIMVSPRFQEYHLAGVSKNMRIKIQGENNKYLEYHRKYVFQGA
ncbi:TPA: HNH endonuclease [Vibrio parahaemolyticus]|nr:HNH endonuclease [Vibrio parahaemolyticus]HAS6625528.1 HNH endonuclease [Vibrio parahaemolyticus]HAS6636063.1 HNH endonuclease [Vibrio parahaemolyticus]HAS6652559.1 HNH endonuclease [Vibrio parahaemolyticus]HAS6657925.1 HNH endonuclease [Vibrio parahaemolyticus]